MTTTQIALPTAHKPNPYTGGVAVDFEDNLSTGRLKSIKIKTERLELRPTALEDVKAYSEIFCDEQNMALYYGGKLTLEKTKNLVIMYVTRWFGLGKYQGNPYPYSGFSIIYNNEVVGHIALGNGNVKGEAQVGYGINSKFHHLGIAKESTTAVVLGLIPKLFEKGYHINLHVSSSTGEDLSGEIKYIKATARPINKYSWYVLEDVGFTRYGYDEKTDLFDYRISIAEILSKKV